MFERLPGEITVFEVGPRDGLQNEAGQVETADKVALIEALAQSGLKHIEITSFVSPKWIPQLADGLAVARQLQLPADVQTSALVPNLKGYEGACAAGLKQINLFLSASESHSKKNINKSVAEALSTMKEVAAAALADGKRIRCYVSTVFACPYEGPVKPEQVVMVVEGLLKIGVHEISLGDTIGAANPRQVKEVLDRLSGVVPLPRLALHFHDTRGTALANVVAGIESGVTIFDSSLGGLGGCPYAPGASGNLATEDLVYMLEGMGIKTGVNLERLVDAGALAEKILGKKLPGRYLQAALATRAKACAG
ncbi:MAG TPA: hydroxymethylglutaryl-CoA lyase [Candidatus Obscuribacter sp.]|nr:hydroxymethylglutaryl-CoA lyase [Candidatus Obscuribacter sp.]HND07969.1 hydroxymethylglutaryl-CoA lyase [Candidatus Obscuribacter sp.]